MKRIISIALVLISLLTLISCGDREYDENEVKAAAKHLISESALLNEIYWGDGLPYSEDKNTADGVYYEAMYYYHHNLGFDNIAELKAKTAKVFSNGYCANIYSTLLDGIQDGDKAILLSRYYQKYSATDGKTPQAIMVNSTWEQLLVGEVEYDLESIKVIGSEEKFVYVTLNATVKLTGYEPQTREIRVSLIEEEDGWRLDSPTYLNYDTTNINNK